MMEFEDCRHVKREKIKKITNDMNKNEKGKRKQEEREREREREREK